MGSQRGFTVVDVTAIMAVVGVVAALAAVGLGESRRSARTVTCEARQQTIGAGNAAFALSNQDKMAGFLSEQAGVGTAAAHAQEAIAILNARGRPDIPPINGWVPDPLYSHLALVEFQDRSLSDEFNVCPSDRWLSRWRRDPARFDQGGFLPMQPTPSPTNKRWPYSSSYEATAGAWDRRQSQDVAATSGTAVLNRLYQSGNVHNLYTVPGQHNLGPSMMSIVAMPSRKVHVFEEHARHFGGGEPYFMYDTARAPMLFFDGSVRVELSADANTGWNPNAPEFQFPTFVMYSPMSWDPPVPAGQSASVGDSHRWTRNGLLGWDYLE